MTNRPQEPPAQDPVAREKQLINLAVDLAEKQLIEGTASPSVLTHYLKLASTRETVEREILEKQAKLITAKTDSISQAKDTEEMVRQAIDAMRTYSGSN